jgi:hypothetical protein
MQIPEPNGIAAITKGLRSPETIRRYDLSYKVRYFSAVTEAAP